MKKISWIFAVAVVLFAAAKVSAFTTPGFQNPYGVVVDPKTSFIYVSNVNGDMTERDDNGFISRLKGDGSIDNIRFIDGAAKEIDLHAPKGMAIVGTTLYVADIEKLHAFDLAAGKLLFDINFGTLPVQHFYDVSTGPDEALYLSDGPGNTIYRVDVPRLHEVTTLVSGEILGQPHGICWFPARQVFVVAGKSSGQVKVFDRSGKPQPTPAVFLRTLEGVAADDSGNLYIASSELSAVFKIGPNFALSTFGMGINSPAGVTYQRSANQIITALFNSGEVRSIPIETNPQAPPPKQAPMQ